MTNPFDDLRSEIINHESNAIYTEQGLVPLFAASPNSKIIVVGQAPGIRAQTSNLPWNDASGERLKKWLGVSQEQFRDTNLFAHLPMDFYYPGKGKSGDLPPRKGFAALWHPRFREHMKQVELTIVIGKYSQGYYLEGRTQRNLTETVYNYHDYLPEFIPLVHPSPLNFRWFTKNTWFERDLVPELQKIVSEIINHRQP